MTNPGDDERGAETAAADLKRSMEDLNRLSDSFGASLTRGLRAAVVEGRALDGVLKGLALRLSGQVIDAALKPLSGLVGSWTSGLTGAIGEGFGKLLKGVNPFAGAGTVAAPTVLPMSGGRLVAPGEGSGGAAQPTSVEGGGKSEARPAGGAVNVTFNVRTGDAESFRRSEAQVSAMLARAVGRGRRGL